MPSFYIVMDDLAHLTNWLFGRFIGASDEPKLAGSLEELAVQQSKTEMALEQLTDKIEDVEERILSSVARKPASLKAAE